MAKARFRGMGSRLKELREAAGLTQQQMAFNSGLSVGIVTKMEQGQLGNPKLNTMQALARALGLTTGRLVDELERAESQEKPKKGGRKS